MSFSTIMIIYIGVGSIGLLGIILSIINLVNLSSTSSAINQLQTDIDKKEKEFDALKKGVAESNASASHGPQGQYQDQDNDQQIEVVRNIRSGYAGTGEESRMEQETLDMGKKPPLYQAEIAPAFTVDGGDILDVVEEQQTDAASEQMEQKSMTIPLYSQSGKDADFKALWRTLIQALEETEGLHANIDFKNIMFLYEKEIEYLRKIKQTVEMQNGTLSFINCSKELEPILNNDPALCTLIKRE